MPKDSWKVGDIVRLKSGGPSMTVVAKEARTEVDENRCGWFVDGCSYQSERFASDALMEAEADSEQL